MRRFAKLAEPQGVELVALALALNSEQPEDSVDYTRAGHWPLHDAVEAPENRVLVAHSTEEFRLDVR